MRKLMKKRVPSQGDFICWCEKRFDDYVGLRKHLEVICPTTLRRHRDELNKWIAEKEAQRRSKHKADLRAWEEEKARGPM